MKAFISNKYRTMEALESEVELTLTENTLSIRFQYHPSDNEEFDSWRTIGVNANQLLNAVQSVMGQPGIKYEVYVLSDSYNTYPNDILKISFDTDTRLCKIVLDHRGSLYFDREEVIEVLNVLRASCGSD